MMDISILYKDKDIAAINKPAGLVVHSDGKIKEKTLADWILQKFPQAKDVGEDILRPGVVHRLDRETSGVMLIAKTQKGFETLKKQFQNHKIKKVYHAFVWREMKNDKGSIERPIGRSKSDFRKWSAQRGARGKMREAITNYEVLKKCNGYSLVKIMPKTGRTHQVRVHFKAINYPLVGDSLYGPKRRNDLGFERLALHSQEIKFENIKGDIITVVAPEPKDFKIAKSKMMC